jgi:hypothetical protein
MAVKTKRGKNARTRKARVIHTRVPVELEKELKRFADKMRIPVSNLIRTILEDALSMAETASENVERELRTGAARLAHGRNVLRRKIKGRILSR